MSTSNTEGGVEAKTPLAPPVSNQILCNWIFTRLENGLFECRNCGQKDVKKAGNGYQFFLSHLAKKTCFGCKIVKQTDSGYNEGMQPAWRAFPEAHKDGGGNSMFRPRISDTARAVHGWIELVVLANNAVSICENPVYRRHVKINKISRKTLRCHIIKLADVVGMLIRESIGPGNCIADGWSCGGVHYFAILHRWPTLEGDNIVVKDALLSYQPLIDETQQSSENHKESILATYELFGDPHELIVVCTMDNTNVNPMTARLLHVPMIGAYCHRLNLASRHWLNDAFDGELMKILDTINAIMKRACANNARGKLKEYSAYKPQVGNKTRWTGYHNMGLKYLKLHEPLMKTGDYTGLDAEKDSIDIDENITQKTKKVLPNLLSNPAFRQFKDEMAPCLDELRRWFKLIQMRMTLDGAMALFDCAQKSVRLRNHSDEWESRLDCTHHLVVAPDFEQGTRKILEGKTESMTAAERRACKCLLKKEWPRLYPQEESEQDKDDADASVEPLSPSKFIKRYRDDSVQKQRQTLESTYITDCSWITPTTVEIEQLFSKCSRVMTADRRKMHPRIFEAVVCLKQNSEWWDLSLVQAMLSGVYDDRLNEVYEGYKTQGDVADEDDVELDDSDEEIDF